MKNVVMMTWRHSFLWRVVGLHHCGLH